MAAFDGEGGAQAAWGMILNFSVEIDSKWTEQARNLTIPPHF